LDVFACLRRSICAGPRARSTHTLLYVLLAACSASGAALGVASGGIGWDALYRELDRLPVFVLANAQSAPLQFEREGQPLAVFYESPAEAEAALVQAVEAYPALGLRLMPTGLGNALRMVRDGGRGVLVPEASNLRAARSLAPILDGAAAWGAPGSLPLFGCPSMRKPLDDGRSSVPLFLSHADAVLALAAAAGGDAAAAGLVLECCPLISMAEQLVGGGVEGPIQFVPSRETARYCAKLQRKLGAQRPPEGISSDTAMRALTTIFDGRTDSSGLFPS